MKAVDVWLAGYGLAVPDNAGLIAAGEAGTIVIVALLLGVLAGRTLGPWLSGQWRVEGSGPAHELHARLCAIVRHGSAALLLAIAVNAHRWPELAAAILGLALGAAVARGAVEVLRGLGIQRWMAWSVALILFVSLFSHAIGGLAPISGTLDSIGFDVGTRRFSLLALVTALVIAVALFAAVRLANKVVAHWVSHTDGLDPTQRLLAQKLAGIVILVVAFFVGIDLLGIDLTAFAVFSGALGLAVGFGLQKTFGNLFAGIILLMDRSIKPGDVIVVGDSFGWVNKIGVRAVSVVTRDGKEHLIPNENLMTQEVENWSYSDRNVRVRIPVIVGYDSDLKLAQELMARAVKESARVLDSPPSTIRLEAFGQNGLEHEILAWISDPEGGVGNVRSDVLNRLWWLFKEHGVTVPYPQREVHLRPAKPIADARE